MRCKAGPGDGSPPPQSDGVRWLMRFLLRCQALVWEKQWAARQTDVHPQGGGSLSEKSHFRRAFLAWPPTALLCKSQVPLHVDVVRPELLLSSGNSVFSQAETKSRASFKGMRLRGIEPVLQGSQIPVGCGGGDGTRVDPFPWWGFEMSSPLSCSPCGAARLAGCAPTVLSAPLPGPEEETWLFQDFTHQSGRRLLDLQGTTKHIPSSAQRSQRPCETKPTVRRSSVAGPGARRCRPMHKKTKLLQALVTGGRRSSPGPAHGREGAT